MHGEVDALRGGNVDSPRPGDGDLTAAMNYDSRSWPDHRTMVARSPRDGGPIAARWWPDRRAIVSDSSCD